MASYVMCPRTSEEESEAEVGREMLEVVLRFLDFGPFTPGTERMNGKRQIQKQCSNH